MSFTDDLVCTERDISGLYLSVDVVYNLLAEFIILVWEFDKF